MPCTGLKCLNANFIYLCTHLPGRGGGAFFFYSEFCSVFVFSLIFLIVYKAQ